MPSLGDLTERRLRALLSLLRMNRSTCNSMMESSEPVLRTSSKERNDRSEVKGVEASGNRRGFSNSAFGLVPHPAPEASAPQTWDRSFRCDRCSYPPLHNPVSRLDSKAYRDSKTPARKARGEHSINGISEDSYDREVPHARH